MKSEGPNQVVTEEMVDALTLSNPAEAIRAARLAVDELGPVGVAGVLIDCGSILSDAASIDEGIDFLNGAPNTHEVEYLIGNAMLAKASVVADPVDPENGVPSMAWFEQTK